MRLWITPFYGRSKTGRRLGHMAQFGEVGSRRLHPSSYAGEREEEEGATAKEKTVSEYPHIGAMESTDPHSVQNVLSNLPTPVSRSAYTSTDRLISGDAAPNFASPGANLRSYSQERQSRLDLTGETFAPIGGRRVISRIYIPERTHSVTGRRLHYPRFRAMRYREFSPRVINVVGANARRDPIRLLKHMRHAGETTYAEISCFPWLDDFNRM